MRMRLDGKRHRRCDPTGTSKDATSTLSPAVWGAALFLGLFCSGIAFVIQTTQQRHTSPARVALIFTLEPVFSAVVAYFLAGERLHPRAYLGAAIMFLSLVLTQVEFGGRKRNDDV